jgi:hypothetical protein
MILAGIGLMLAFRWWEQRRVRLAEQHQQARKEALSRNTKRKLRGKK